MTDAPFDIKTIQGRPLGDRRELAATIVSRLLASGRLEESEVGEAHDILSSLSHDAEVRVRKALAQAVSQYPMLPTNIAERLAKDVAEVAVPVLELSTVLSDDFLVSVIVQGELDRDRQAAIARRPSVSESLSHALVETEDTHVVGTLLRNENASISDDTLDQALEKHATDGDIPLLIVKRPDLSSRIVHSCHSLILAHTIESGIADDMRSLLVDRYALPENMADDIVRDARERAAIELTGAEEDEGRVAGFARALHERGEITPSLLLRSICGGDIVLFEHGLACLTGAPVETVRSAVRGVGADAFRDLYFKAGLPAYMRRAFTVAKTVIAQELAAGRKPDPAVCIPNIVSQIVEFYRNIGPGPFDSVMAQINREMLRWQNRSNKNAAIL